MVHKTIAFRSNGQNYDVRVIETNTGFDVRVYRADGRAANGYTYHVDHTTNLDHVVTNGRPAYEHLVEIAKSDVENRVWESYCAAVRSDNSNN